MVKAGALGPLVSAVVEGVDGPCALSEDSVVAAATAIILLPSRKQTQGHGERKESSVAVENELVLQSIEAEKLVVKHLKRKLPPSQQQLTTPHAHCQHIQSSQQHCNMYYLSSNHTHPVTPFKWRI